VANVFTKFDRERYWHHAWVLMPNHAHLLFSIKEGVALPELLKVWKGTSSRAAGLNLGRRMTDEAFWQKDYFDRIVRDAEHFWNCVGYIRRNPVKAKLREDAYTLYVSEDSENSSE
jgi:REP element-mobilizing transposase RayT